MPVLDDQKQEKFCQLVFKGKSDLQAYAEAYECSSESAHTNAWRARASEGVTARITELFTKVEAKNVLTMAEKREFLRSVVMTPVGQINEQSHLCQSFKRRTRKDRDGTETEEIDYELPNKLKAVELDAKLAGELRDNHTEIKIAVFTQGEAPVIDV